MSPLVPQSRLTLSTICLQALAKMLKTRALRLWTAKSWSTSVSCLQAGWLQLRHFCARKPMDMLERQHKALLLGVALILFKVWDLRSSTFMFSWHNYFTTQHMGSTFQPFDLFCLRSSRRVEKCQRRGSNAHQHRVFCVACFAVL